MDIISAELANEIQQRLDAGSYASADELVRLALTALDDVRDATTQWLEHELLQGFEGSDVEMTSNDWKSIESEAINQLDPKNGS